MRFSSLGYIFKQGFKNIRHNLMFSIASVATMATCIFLVGLFTAALLNLNNIVKSVEEEVTVTVFFEENLPEDQIHEIAKEIEKSPEVLSMKFTSAEEVWAMFKEKYFEGSEDLAEGFETDNPLAHSANYEIKVNNIEDQDSLVKKLESIQGIRKINRSVTAVKVLSSINRLLGYGSIILIGILMIVSIFLISNTVALGIAVRKEEIGIMKLIGAKNGFIRGPFIVEGLMLSLLGTVVPLALLYFGYNKVITTVMSRFNILTSFLKFLGTNEVFQYVLPVSAILGLGIGLIASSMTVRKHLKV